MGTELISGMKRLEDLQLLEDYQNGKLTINGLAYALKTPFFKIEKHLYNLGYIGNLNLNSKVNEQWLQSLIPANAAS